MTSEGAGVTGSGVEIRGYVSDEFAMILTPSALSFVADLERAFDKRRRELLQIRDDRQEIIDAGGHAGFLT